MDLAIKSNEMLATDEIRPLTDIEIDGVSGGGAMLIGALALAATFLVADRTQDCPWHHW